jgi:hypothetical protein
MATLTWEIETLTWVIAIPARKTASPSRIPGPTPAWEVQPRQVPPQVPAQLPQG